MIGMKQRMSALALTIPTVVAVLAGCGGSVGGAGGSSAGSGFEFGASQDDVDAAIADLDPVTLTFQPYAASPNSPAAAGAHAFMEAVEARSGGKIEFDVAWGQSIAAYPEVDDALADGRLDIAYSVPIYFPAEYPLTDAYNKVSHYSMASPMVGEAISHAMMTEAGWNDPKVIEQYTDKGLVPLNPLVSSGNYWLACNSPGTAPDDWQGRQIRIGGSAQTPVSEAIGASPVSMEYGEAFEALQRSTVDCTFVQGQVAGSTGLMEAAPYGSTFADSRITGGVTAGQVAGSSFANLPLAYQQIIFDAVAIDYFHGQVLNVVEGSAQAVSDAKEAGGGLTAIDPEVEETISKTQEENVDAVIDDGLLPEDIRDQLGESADKWTGIVEELGYEDGGELADLDEWYEPGSVDFRPLAERLFEDAAAQHRPE